MCVNFSLMTLRRNAMSLSMTSRGNAQSRLCEIATATLEETVLSSFAKVESEMLLQRHSGMLHVRSRLLAACSTHVERKAGASRYSDSANRRGILFPPKR